VLPPALDDDFCLLERVEDFSVEQFVPELRVEAFAIAILPRAARHDEEIGQHVDDINSLQLSLNPDGDAFSRELVDHIEHADFPSIVSAVLDKIIRPDMVGVFRLKPDTRTVVQPEPTALGLLGWNLQPLTPPYPLDPFDVHDPACLVQHRRDAAIAISAILKCKRRDVGGQCRFIIRGLCDFALRGTMLS